MSKSCPVFICFGLIFKIVGNSDIDNVLDTALDLKNNERNQFVDVDCWGIFWKVKIVLIKFYIPPIGAYLIWTAVSNTLLETLWKAVY